MIHLAVISWFNEHDNFYLDIRSGSDSIAFLISLFEVHKHFKHFTYIMT